MTPEPEPEPVIVKDVAGNKVLSLGTGDFYDAVELSDGTIVDLSASDTSTLEINGSTARYYAVNKKADNSWYLMCSGSSDYGTSAFRYFYVNTDNYWKSGSGTNMITPYGGMSPNISTRLPATVWDGITMRY